MVSNTTTTELTMSTQKDSVFAAVTSFYGNKFENGMSHTKEAKQAIVASLCESFEAGEITVKSEQENIKTYMIGLLNNHLRKDVRLNGGEKYVAKNPGSRAGQGDPEIKASRAFLKSLAEGDERIPQVEAFIAKKIAENKAAKATTEIDVDALPAELQSLVG